MVNKKTFFFLSLQNYQWFLPHWYSKDWYDTDKLTGENNVSCTTEQMLYALRGHMSLSYKYFADDDAVMQEGKTVKEWRQAYSNVCSEVLFEQCFGYM